MKTAIRNGLIVIVIIVAGLIAAPFFIDVNDYKDTIAQKVEDATGRALTIGGIKASLFPWVGVELENVHMANPDGFEEKDFASVEHLDIKLAVLPLLDGRYEIKEFKLVRPHLYLARNEQGHGNWEDLAGSASSEKPAADAKGKKPENRERQAMPVLAGLAADHLLIKDGRLVWHDPGSQVHLELGDLNVDFKDVQLDHPVMVKVSGTIQGDPFDIKGSIGPIGDPGKLQLARLPVQLDVSLSDVHLGSFASWLEAWPEFLGPVEKARIKLVSQLEQHPDGQRAMHLDAHLGAAHDISAQGSFHSSDVDSLDIQSLDVGLDQEMLLKLSGKIRNIQSSPNYELKLASGKIQRTWLSEVLPDLKKVYEGHPAPWSHLRLSSLLVGDRAQVDVRDLQLVLDQDVIQGSGRLKLTDSPDVHLQLAGTALHLDPWLPAPAEKDAQAPSANVAASVDKPSHESPRPGEDKKAGHRARDDGQAPSDGDQKAAAAEPDLRFMKDWKLGIRLELETLFVRGLELTGFRSNINGAKGKIMLNPMRFGLAGGKVEEQATLLVDRFPVHWKESAHVMGVHLGPVLKVLAGTDRLEGTLNAETDLRAVGLTSQAVRRLNGKGNVMLRDGKIKGLDVAGAIRAVTHPGSAQQGPKETDFTQLSGSFVIR
ncbi:MAG: AsmA family protein, partial [Zetaproteobacteria bacterium]